MVYSSTMRFSLEEAQQNKQWGGFEMHIMLNFTADKILFLEIMKSLTVLVPFKHTHTQISHVESDNNERQFKGNKRFLVVYCL